MTLDKTSLILFGLTCGVAHAATGVITYAVIGAADPNKKVTTLDGVSGAGVSNVDMPLPVYILTPGVVYTVTIGAQNDTYSGSCVASYALGTGANGGYQNTAGDPVGPRSTQGRTAHRRHAMTLR
jgi:hypothetical protein